ncbi:MAG: SOS response-associated peptidase, partial [Ilumatobacteraceae bacterium]
NYNIAPTATIYGVVGRDQQRYVENFSWGLVPVWSKDRSRASSLINARSETITEKPSFRGLLNRYRCVVPLTGYYEWKSVEVAGSTKAIKQPYYFRPTQSALFAVAGLWTTWRQPGLSPDAPVLHSCVLITTSANDTASTVHDRMPVLLDEDGVDEWITDDDVAPLHLLRPAPNEALSVVKVSTTVNSTRNQGPQLIEQIPTP